MTNDNYKYILADDHNGNKALVIIRGELNNKLVSPANVHEITDPAFTPYAKQLRKILEQVATKKDGDHSCN